MKTPCGLFQESRKLGMLASARIAPLEVGNQHFAALGELHRDNMGSWNSSLLPRSVSSKWLQSAGILQYLDWRLLLVPRYFGSLCIAKDSRVNFNCLFNTMLSVVRTLEPPPT